MLCPCIQTLDRIMHGQLRFGSMPPLGGQYEPIGRLIPVGVPIRKNDVVIDCHIDDWRSNTPEFCAADAYLRGALGVISPRAVTTWDGCFSIQIDAGPAAIERVANWVRAQQLRPVAAVLDDRVDSPLGESLRSKAMRRIDREPLTGLSGDRLHSSLAARSLWEWLNWRSSSQRFVATATRSDAGMSLLRLLQPDIVVFRGKATGEPPADVALCQRLGTPFRIGESGETDDLDLQEAALTAMDEVDASLSTLHIATA